MALLEKCTKAIRARLNKEKQITFDKVVRTTMEVVEMNAKQQDKRRLAIDCIKKVAQDTEILSEQEVAMVDVMGPHMLDLIIQASKGKMKVNRIRKTCGCLCS